MTKRLEYTHFDKSQVEFEYLHRGIESSPAPNLEKDQEEVDLKLESRLDGIGTPPVFARQLTFGQDDSSFQPECSHHLPEEDSIEVGFQEQTNNLESYFQSPGPRLSKKTQKRQGSLVYETKDILSAFNSFQISQSTYSSSPLYETDKKTRANASSVKKITKVPKPSV